MTESVAVDERLLQDHLATPNRVRVDSYPNGFAWVKVFEWWAGRTSTIRYGIALACLGLSTAAWFEYGRISLWGFATGIVLLIAALVIRN